MPTARHVGTYVTQQIGWTGVVFTVGWPNRLVVLVGADGSIVETWRASGWTRSLAVFGLAQSAPNAYPRKSNFGSIVWYPRSQLNASFIDAARSHVASMGYAAS